MRHATPFLRSFQHASSNWLIRGTTAVSVAVFVSVANARAADAPAVPAPQTQPAISPPADVAVPPVVAPPVVAPADQAPVQPARPPKIVVLPFANVGGRAGDAWISRSIQQSIMTDLMATTRAQVISAGVAPEDTAAAASLGHKLGASFVVFGQLHATDAALRITGEIVATETDSVAGTLKVTGPVNDLFGLEDALGNQARGALRQLEIPKVASNVLGGQPLPPPAEQPSGPVQMVPYPVNTESPYVSVPVPSPTYPVDPYYPGDYYGPYDSGLYAGYPLFYGGVGFGIGGRGFRGHGFGGRGGVGGHFGGTGNISGGGHAGGGHGGGHR